MTSPTFTGRRNAMSVAATVATRPRASAPAAMPPATSIRDISQPPKMSPAGLVSAGMARVRTASSPLGSSAGIPAVTPASVDITPASFERDSTGHHMVMADHWGDATDKHPQRLRQVHDGGSKAAA